MRRTFRNSDTKTIICVVVAVLLIGFGVTDFWTGGSKTNKATIERTWMDVDTSTDSDGNVSIDHSYYADITSDENYGMPLTISINRGKYRGLHQGQEVTVETAWGGITGFTYYKRIR